VVSHEGFRFDLRVVPPECYGNLLQHFTGSKDHNIALREDAQRRRLSVSEYGVTETESGEVFTAETEEELYERLGYAFIPPELRKGVEVNIKADGTLDVTDELLAERDWVVASIHTAFQREPTERVISAMENPHVDVIGHLTGRKLSRREPMEIDIERVFEKALETGTLLEINSQPDRLDLSDVNARLAGEA